jgi:hypothetical protein
LAGLPNPANVNFFDKELPLVCAQFVYLAPVVRSSIAEIAPGDCHLNLTKRGNTNFRRGETALSEHVN